MSKKEREEETTKEGFEDEARDGCKKNKEAEGFLKKKIKAFGLGRIFSSLE